MPKNKKIYINAALKAIGPQAKAIKCGFEAPRGQGLASRTTSLLISIQQVDFRSLSRIHSPAVGPIE